MPEIAMIAPYKRMADMAAEINGNLAEPIGVETALLSEAVGVARRFQQNGVQVLISRGGTAMAIRKAPGIILPVVEISVTGYDIVRAVGKAREIDRRMAVIGFENMIMGARTLSEVLGVRITEHLLSHEEECEAAVRKAAADGAGVIIGGVIAMRWAKRMGVAGILIDSGEEGIRQAINEARRVLWVKKQENTRSRQFRLILDYVSDGVVATDEKGKITVLNAIAEKIIGLPAGEAIGRHISEMAPGLGISRTPKAMRPAIADLREINGTPVSLNRVPILANDSYGGTVVTFQEISKIQSLERKVRNKLHNRGLVAKFTFEDLVGISKAMAGTVEKARRFARADSTILIVGETGTGKELLAQSIHNASNRRDGPFVAVNCAALPENLLESELFGYVSGAFTGARKEGKAGLFELGHGGTILLDEIAGMSTRLQERLLRVLQEKEVMRLGDDRVIPVDVRVIAATNKELEVLMAEGRFQQDLYYRLDVLKLVVPPLRERREDIPLLAAHFARQFCRQLGVEEKAFSRGALNALSARPWHGNVRELQNAVEKLVVLCDGNEIGYDDVGRILDEWNGTASPAAGIAGDSLLRDSIRRAEYEAIKRVLRQVGGNKTEAARVLGIDRATLWRKLKEE
ncbi:MAG: sigma 54-interacting transcriptional regulator [Firmicutes bacterium]|nr:sigma 54-interacting transcriptional regulator [Bacillota bacterium]